ncbi:MAG: ABC transporter ATP-binding protein [Oscillospiraceae bacterium]|nr:ABC transporter ATP-binding protein [Oscillospiraceae bacterium]
MQVINVEGVSKKFKIYKDKPASLKDKVIHWRRNTHEDFWALRDVNLTIQKGETVGLIGQNGSGKSTLLKLLTRIMYPTSGTVKIDGRVSSLIELGAGFHHDMTGRENIYTNASIFGMSRSEIESKIAGIIEFSELGEFIDNAVRTYSSGMYMRLAFAVAISVDPDILLIDEILAVGDANFQRKCFERLYEMKKQGVTIVLVSHDLNSIQRICERTIWFKDGMMVEDGKSTYVTEKYLNFMSDTYDNPTEEPSNNEQAKKQPQPSDADSPEQENRRGSGEVKLSGVRMTDSTGAEASNIHTRDGVNIICDYTINDDVDSLVFGINIKRSDGVHVYGIDTFAEELQPDLQKKSGTVTFTIESFNLLEGTYLFDVSCSSKIGRDYDYLCDALKLTVNNSTKETGIVSINHRWDV